MKLRHVVDEDHVWLVELHNDPIVLKNLINPDPISLQHHMVWWSGISNNPKQLRLIFEVDEVSVGFTKFYDIDLINHNCVLGADIHRNFRGIGYAKYMWALMLNVCFDNLKLHRVALSTAAFNQIGQRVYKNLGFKEEGRYHDVLFRDGEYHDGICMYMLREDWVS
jgi:RimJ/RimL family protein N-acetyltransferase